MKYYVYFDAYGHAKQIIVGEEMADRYHNEPDEFLSTACRTDPRTETGPMTGQEGTLSFDTEKDLRKYLAGL